MDTTVKPYVSKIYCVENNQEFLKKSKFKHTVEDYRISFDLVSLFSNVALNENIEKVLNKAPEKKL